MRISVMRLKVLLPGALLCLSLVLPETVAQEESSNDTSIWGIKVVNQYPHDINLFTQGLFYHDGHLYEGTGKRGLSALSKRSLVANEVIMSSKLSSRYFGEGIALVDDKIYQLTWQSHMVFVYSRDSFEQLTTHYNATEGWGLAYDGAELILSDGSATLQFIDPENFIPQRKITVTLNGNPVRNLNELEYIDGEIWANVWQTDFILRIDPATGETNSYIDLSGLSGLTQLGSNEAVLNGIAWDDEQDRLFVTGKHWAHVFEIELVAP
ncbi:MAG: glutaminyl-peptide cyclotransferase [Pseudomonadales bacterium]|nr:glutaminyl-peptide cyclotransferase [Pseudomonadales bacterium]